MTIEKRWKIGYVSSGLTSLKIQEVISFICHVGYAHLEIELNYKHLHPHHHPVNAFKNIATKCKNGNVSLTLATGGTNLLSHKDFEPSLISNKQEERRARIDFTKKVVEIAHHMGVGCITLQSGVLSPQQKETTAWEMLVEGVGEICLSAQHPGVIIGFEPHPDHYIASLQQFERLKEQVGLQNLKLTLDVGHAACVESKPLSDLIERYAPVLANIHIEDIKSGVHKHLPLGCGDIDFPSVFKKLAAVGYAGPVSAEFYGEGLDEKKLCEETFTILTRYKQTGRSV